MKTDIPGPPSTGREIPRELPTFVREVGVDRSNCRMGWDCIKKFAIPGKAAGKNGVYRNYYPSYGPVDWYVLASPGEGFVYIKDSSDVFIEMTGRIQEAVKYCVRKGDNPAEVFPVLEFHKLVTGKDWDFVKFN